MNLLSSILRTGIFEIALDAFFQKVTWNLKVAPELLELDEASLKLAHSRLKSMMGMSYGEFSTMYRDWLANYPELTGISMSSPTPPTEPVTKRY